MFFVVVFELMIGTRLQTGRWGIGWAGCQVWLSIDYLMSNASVLNLLLISFDRYFSITRPLTYRPRRTTRKALTAIFGAYAVSLVLWPPWIIGCKEMASGAMVAFALFSAFMPLGSLIRF